MTYVLYLVVGAVVGSLALTAPIDWRTDMLGFRGVWWLQDHGFSAAAQALAEVQFYWLDVVAIALCSVATALCAKSQSLRKGLFVCAGYVLTAWTFAIVSSTASSVSEIVLSRGFVTITLWTLGLFGVAFVIPSVLRLRFFRRSNA